MTAFIVRRALWTIPVILLVILLTFVLMRQIEGNPFRTSERAIPESIQRNLDEKYGLDRPWYVQYAKYVEGVVTFDLGPSLVLRNRDVNGIVKEHLPPSLELGALAMLFALVVGVPLGMVSALRGLRQSDGPLGAAMLLCAAPVHRSVRDREAAGSGRRCFDETFSPRLRHAGHVPLRRHDADGDR